MKKILVTLVALCGIGTAFANADMSWEEIRKDSTLLATFPMVSFNYVSVSVDGLCVDAQSLRPFDPAFERCVAWDNNSENPTCVETETVSLITPIRYTVTECAEWNNNSENISCTRYVNVEKVHALEYNVNVFDANRFGQEGGGLFEPIFTKKYTIPSCN